MTATPSVDREALRRKSAPLLLCERARTTPGSGGVAVQASRALSRAQLARLRGAGGARGTRLACSRPRARRPHRHHGGRLRRMDDLRPRGAIARRHRLRHLSDRFGCRGRIPDARRRRRDLRRREPGIRRQDPAPSPIAWPVCEWIVVLDRSAMFAYAHPKLRSYETLLPRPNRSPISPGSSSRRHSSIRMRRPSSSTPPAPPVHPKGALVTHGTHLAATANLVDHYPRWRTSSTARWATCRSAMCSAATSQ